MSEEMLVMHCSPTLAGQKTGNLFSCSYRDSKEVLGFLRHWNTMLREKGIRLLPLRFKNGKALIYVYRPSQLNKDFHNDGVCQLLAQQGYCTENCQQCVVRLIHKLRESAEFPHEIGLFLGYPCEDVKGFIENKAARAKCVGCLWSTATRKKRKDNLNASRNAQRYIKSKTRTADRSQSWR